MSSVISPLTGSVLSPLLDPRVVTSTRLQYHDVEASTLHMTTVEGLSGAGVPPEHLNLAAGASWLGMDVVRLGRSAAGETLGQGCWRSRLQVCRRGPEGRRWELVDPLEISGASLAAEHGMAGQPVLGSLVWAAPEPLGAAALAQLLADCRSDRQGLEGDLACGALDQGLIARYRGPSSQAARFWVTRVWARIRAARGLSAPELPRVWPFQEQPLGSG